MEQTSRKKKKVFAVIAILLLAGAAAGGWWWYQSTLYVSTDDARVSGTIITISAKIPGRITEVLVKEGDQVKAGQIVARIDERDIKAQKAQAEASLAAARAKYEETAAGSRPQEIAQNRAAVDQAMAGLGQSRATLDNAAKNYERMQKLSQEGAISTSQLDGAQASYLVAKDAVNAAQDNVRSAGEKLDLSIAGSREESIRAAAAQVKLAEAALEAVNVTADNTLITAPADGTVAQKSVNAGEIVAAAQPLFNVVNYNDLWVNARIEETKIGKINIGQTVDYTIDGYPGQTFSGKVYDITMATNSVFALIPTENSSGNFTKVTQRIPIKITLPQNSGVVFRPGMSVIIKIHIQS